MIYNVLVKTIPSTIYNLVFGTKSYSTPSADWLYNPRHSYIEQHCHRDNMKQRIIRYNKDNRTYSKHIDRMKRQAKTLHISRV